MLRKSDTSGSGRGPSEKDLNHRNLAGGLLHLTPGSVGARGEIPPRHPTNKSSYFDAIIEILTSARVSVDLQ